MVEREVAQALRLAVFFGFFSFSAVVIAYGRDNEILRKLFTVALVIGCITPLIVSAPFPPFAGYGFFTQPAPDSSTQYTLHVVDSSGEEYALPSEAAPPGRINHQAKFMMTKYSDERSEKLSEFFISRANLHRDRIRDGISIIEARTIVSLVGRPLGRYHWNESTVSSMEPITGVRIYKTTVTAETGTAEVVERSRELVYTYNRTT